MSDAMVDLVHEARSLVNSMTDTPLVRNVVIAALDEQQRTIARLRAALEAGNAQFKNARDLLNKALASGGD